MIRFLHTGDWQLGMTRHYLAGEAQARYAQARFDAVRSIGRVAAEQGCRFVLACGDVFEDNQVDRRTVARACEALAAVSVPVYLLPGNHDPLNAASVFRSATFLERKPAHVHVIETTDPITVAPGVELVGAPWTSKRPLKDLVAAALEPLAPLEHGVRVVAGHGAVDTLSPDPGNPALISLAAAEAAARENKMHYLALGDRHSRTLVGGAGRVAYAGTPEPTDYDEVDAGHVLVVDVARDGVTTTAIRTGTWRYARRAFDLAGDADLDLLDAWLREMPDKERTIVKLALVGTLSVRQRARLADVVADARDKFGAVEESARASDLRVIPEDADFADLDLQGFARTAVERLRQAAAAPGDDAVVARDALGLLLRLATRPA